MIIIYSMLNRDLVFAGDPNYVKQSGNQKETYVYTKWEQFGYVDYVPYADYLRELAHDGMIDEETQSAAAAIGRKADKDPEIVAKYVAEFTKKYEAAGYKVVRLDAKLNGKKVAK